MAMSKKEQQAIRNILLRDGTVKGNSAPSEHRAANRAASQRNAIEARRQELQHNNKRG